MATEFDKSKIAELGILGALGAYGANRSRQDTNQQISNLTAGQANFGPDSPYAQQLRQQLERRDAQMGRRSQYGPREVELQAKLAEVNANQQARTAPALQALYQQREGQRGTTGKDIASILARSGAIKGLSPMVQSLFKRRLPFDQGDERDIGLSDGYSTGFMGQSDFTGNAAGYDSYDFQDLSGVDNYDSYDFQDLGSSFDSGGFDLYNGVDAGTYDSYDFQDAGSGGFDLYNGLDAGTYDAYDFQSLPGFAKGGPVNIFQAINQDKQNKTKGYKEIKPSPVEQVVKRAAPQRQEEGLSGIQDISRDLRSANTVSKLAGVKGGILGAYGQAAATLAGAEDTQQGYVSAGLQASLALANPVAAAALGLTRFFGGMNGVREISPEQRKNIASLNNETSGGNWDVWSDSGVQRQVGADGMATINQRDGSDSQYQVATRQVGDTTYAQNQQGEQGEWDDDTQGYAGGTNLGNALGFATGGPVRGPGTGTSDSIVARLSDGEYVNTAATVDSLGTSLFDKLEAKAKKSTPAELKKFKAGLQALF